MKVKAIKKFNFADPSGGTRSIEPGMIEDIPDDIAKNWIKMGWAEGYKPPK